MSDQDSTYQLLSSLFFSFLFIKLADYGKTCKGQSLPVHVNMVLDELPSIGNIPDLGRKLATVRKYGVNVIPIIQLISQLDNRYSPAERDEIIGCCDTQIWLGSNDIASAEVLSERSGTMTVDVSSKMEKAELLPEVRLTSSVGKRPVLTVDEVLRLPLDEEIIVLRGQNILKLKKYKFHDARFIKALCGNNYDQNTGIYKAYGQIESAMKSFDTVMSFSNPLKNNCPTYTMKWNGKEYSLSLTDNKNVLSKFSVSSSDGKVKISKSGNTLTVTSADPISSSIMVTAKKSVTTGSSSTVAYGHESKEIQDVIVKTDSPDPVYGYFKVKTEATGSLKVVKQYKDLNGNNVKSGIESFVLNNTKFKIRNSANKYIKASYSGSGYVYSYTGYVSSASDGTVFTPKNNSGDFYFEVNKLPPGTYEIMEQDNNITGYTPSGSKKIKVAVTANNSGGKKTATFQNKPDQLVINKVFNQFGAAKDEDYAKVVFNLSQINAEGKAATKSFICTDKDNNVYQFINSTSDAAYAGIVTSKELRFANPKVHSITVTGLPIYGKSNTGVEVDETVVTGENGSVSLSLLTGTYTVEEIK